MSQSGPGGIAAKDNPGALVFLVDDELMVGEVVVAILKLGGHQIRWFQDPIKALEGFRDSDPKPDLLLTDYKMPQMTGRELIQRCKEAHPALKTILYSGDVQEDTAALYKAKPDRLLRKPFVPNTLLDLVKQVLAE